MSALLACAILLTGCGGGDEEATVPEAEAPAPPPAATPAAGTSTVGVGQAETLSDVPFNLNTEQPVPPNFSEAYGRRDRIAFQFYKLDEDSLDYPQGLSVDRGVRDAM